MSHEKNAGFTLIEVIVTIVAGTLFLIAIYQLSILSLQLSSSSSRFTTASNLSYANLKLYANSDSPTWFSCQDLGDGWGYSKRVLYSTASVTGLPSPVIQSVVATPTRTCTTYPSAPLQVVSTVTYGSGAQKVIHVSYAGY